MEDFNTMIEELKAEAVKVTDKEELFDMGMVSGMLKIVYEFKDLGDKPSLEAIEDMMKKQSAEILKKAIGYMYGINL